MKQEEGIIGKIVGGMIRRTVRARLRNLYWSPPKHPIPGPAIFYINHHGWLDGYLMFHAVTKLGMRSLDWIEEFDTFPLFAKVGGMRFSRGDVIGRANTVRTTIKMMRSEKRSLVIFPEGVMHRPGELLPFGKALETVATKVPEATMVPIAIVYELSMHERPEAWISFGEPHQFESLIGCEEKLAGQLVALREAISSGEKFEILANGTPSINERMSMKGLKKA
ncbi:MAG: 1-acyl-sn-glycerol-3-phosphate acyltransferase [Armatimonadota bacterium]